MSSVLITGADGFLGRYISKDLVQRGFDVYFRRRTDGDVRDSATWEQFPEANYLIHLAGTTFVPASWDNPTEFVHSNLISTSHALDYCRKHKTKMIFFSTYLYSKTARQPTIEEEKIDPANPYALSKLMGEQLCTFYANHFDVEVVVLRPFNVFGSGQDPRFLIPSIISQAKVGSEIRVLDSRPSRDYIFVDDLVDAVVKAMSADVKFDIFNIGTGISHSVSDLINLLGDIVGQEFQITSSSQERFREINSTRADISKAKKILNWHPKWQLKAGLERVWKESI